jgi:hypothetical protein
VAHYRDSEGYNRTWYDVQNDDGKLKRFKFKVPKKEGYLYITAETYFSKIIPYSCSNDVVPLVTIEVFRNGEK